MPNKTFKLLPKTNFLVFRHLNLGKRNVIHAKDIP